MVPPICVVCRRALRHTPEEIGDLILEVENWSAFSGSWPVPGIRSAVMEQRTPEIVGSRIRVTNRDGSRHLEEIVTWDLPRKIELQFSEFSWPICWLASSFLETWTFERQGPQWHTARSMTLFPKSFLAWPALRLVAPFLKRAISKHLAEL